MTPDAPPSLPPRTQRVSLDAVAREAGVSISTASRALGGRPVGSELQERVERAARRLGYRPDLAAQAVARGATKTVALIVDYLRSPFGVEITRGVVDSASAHGLVVNVTGAETHPGDLLEMIANARALRPRSLVLATGRVQDPAIRDDLIRSLEAYQAAGGSVSIVDGLDLPFASCSFDEVTAARALTRALVELGYRRPLVFNGSSERADLAGRTRALTEGFADAGLDREMIRLSEMPTAVSTTVGDAHLVELGDADVVVCVEGSVVPAVYRHIRSQGLHVGTDVGVTSFGQYGFADALRPHLTTVMLPLRRAGALAVEHALADTSGAHLSLACNLRIRASTPQRVGPAESTTGRVARGTARSVGVVLPALSASETGVIVRELFELSRGSGIGCSILTEDSLVSAGSDALRRWDALLVWGSPGAPLAGMLRETDVPYVVVSAPRTDHAAQLSIETPEGMQQLLEHLYALDHTIIGYIAGAEDDPVEKQRRRALDLFTATHSDVRIVTVPHTGLPEDERMLTALVREGGITSVVARDDVQATQIVRQLLASGHSVPDEVSVTGFGGGWAGEAGRPTVTTVRIDPAAAARAAWRMMSAGDAPGEAYSLRPGLLVRDSTGPAPRP